MASQETLRRSQPPRQVRAGKTDYTRIVRRIVRVETERWNTPQPLFEEDAQFQAPEVGADAAVHPLVEGDVPLAAVRAEAGGFGKGLGVAVDGTEHDQELIAGADIDTVELQVTGGGAHGRGHRVEA